MICRCSDFESGGFPARVNGTADYKHITLAAFLIVERFNFIFASVAAHISRIKGLYAEMENYLYRKQKAAYRRFLAVLGKNTVPFFACCAFHRKNFNRLSSLSCRHQRKVAFDSSLVPLFISKAFAPFGD